MDDLLSLANGLIENNNFKNDNNYEEKKPDGDYDVVIKNIKLKTSDNTGTQWFSIVVDVVEGEYANQSFYISLFLTEKTLKGTLAKIMQLITACGYTLDAGAFASFETIETNLQEVIGSEIILHKKTSSKGYINYTFGGEE